LPASQKKIGPVFRGEKKGKILNGGDDGEKDTQENKKGRLPIRKEGTNIPQKEKNLLGRGEEKEIDPFLL